MASIDETTFAKAYLHLLSDKQIEYQDDFVMNTKSLGQRGPIILLKMPTDKLHMLSSSESQEPATASITVKSLRPPKFSIQVEMPVTETIFSLKTQVAADAHISIESLKLLSKGKVISDARSIEDIVDQDGKASLMAMVSAGQTDQSLSNAAEGNAKSKTTSETDTEIDETVWGTIATALVAKVGKTKGDRVLERLRKGYTLAR
ncbi:uncharacterized protein V1516DRAFT_652772 [Lipomyces oligophaga]|uniref:uncharacterized protein n=1 Tax=Lipomyces oligophaga TaxID=45792 RepID=UPI0034CF0988